MANAPQPSSRRGRRPTPSEPTLAARTVAWVRERREQLPERGSSGAMVFPMIAFVAIVIATVIAFAVALSS